MAFPSIGSGIAMIIMLVSFDVALGQLQVTMNINNNLGSNIPLHLHCNSASDDLGERHLSYGESLTWKFAPDLSKPDTVYTCVMQWKSAQGVVWGTFDVYNEQRDLEACTAACLWNIQPYGAYLYDQRVSKFVLMHNWW